jgi:hypothetical protein
MTHADPAALDAALDFFDSFGKTPGFPGNIYGQVLASAVRTLQFDLAAVTIHRDALRRLIEQPNPAVEEAFRAGFREWGRRYDSCDYAWAAFRAEREGRT